MDGEHGGWVVDRHLAADDLLATIASAHPEVEVQYVQGPPLADLTHCQRCRRPGASAVAVVDLHERHPDAPQEWTLIATDRCCLGCLRERCAQQRPDHRLCAHLYTWG